MLLCGASMNGSALTIKASLTFFSAKLCCNLLMMISPEIRIQYRCCCSKSASSVFALRSCTEKETQSPAAVVCLSCDRAVSVACLMKLITWLSKSL